MSRENGATVSAARCFAVDSTFTTGALQNRTEFMFNPSALFGGGNTQIGAINKTTVSDLGQFVWGR